ncbi:MAG TPA: hypothetical protein ENK09_01785 [Nitrospirae bacterium]|nr:hypothetical protein [Nitrospirota bacterium]
MVKNKSKGVLKPISMHRTGFCKRILTKYLRRYSGISLPFMKLRVPVRRYMLHHFKFSYNITVPVSMYLSLIDYSPLNILKGRIEFSKSEIGSKGGLFFNKEFVVINSLSGPFKTIDRREKLSFSSNVIMNFFKHLESKTHERLNQFEVKKSEGIIGIKDQKVLNMAFSYNKVSAYSGHYIRPITYIFRKHHIKPVTSFKGDISYVSKHSNIQNAYHIKKGANYFKESEIVYQNNDTVLSKEIKEIKNFIIKTKNELENLPTREFVNREIEKHLNGKLNLMHITEHVYSELKRRIRLERERRGLYAG